MKLKIILFVALPALLFIGTNLKAQTITAVQQQPLRTSIRGLSIVNDSIAWVSGSGGHVGISSDGGKKWAWQQLKGYEKSDFRDIEAFSATEAVIMSSGTPALILKTTDGGATWQEKYRNADSVYFLDAMAFADKKHGFVLGDPIKGQFLMLETKNGGQTWAELYSAPPAIAGEAAFAASGTCLRADDGLLTIVTGGAKSRILETPIREGFPLWLNRPLPLTNGDQSRGAFSVAIGKSQLVVVGGNYAKDTRADSVAYIMPNGASRFAYTMPVIGPAGYQSCVEYIKGDTFLSTGTPGSNITTDGGKNWVKIDSTSYNVCRKAKKGNLVLLAGDKGKIGIYTP
nr:YCF48-related protein [uncultured Mucilaginibacter sp.]